MENQLNNKELAQMGYNCRVCGKFIHSLDEIPHCLHCQAPTCPDCTSCGFCLNCYLNITEDGRKTLKLLKNLIWFMPLMGFLVLIQSWQKFVIAEIVIICLFLGLYFYSRYTINRKPGRYFNPKWELNIQDPDYLTVENISGQKPLVDAHVDTQLKTMWKKVDPVSEKEIHLKNSSKLMQNEEIEHYEFLLSDDRPTEFHDSSIKVAQLKEQKCPLCGLPLEFKDFCVECQRRFCPQCGEDLNPFSERCLCGEKLTPLFPADDVKGGSITLEELIKSQIEHDKSEQDDNEEPETRLTMN